MKKVLGILQNLLFPFVCVNCRTSTTYEWPLLCTACCSDLELLDCTSRCPYCFQERYQHAQCANCTKNRAHRKHLEAYIASAFDNMGSIKSIVRKFVHNDRPYLAKSLAAFLLLQFEELKWPQPDHITFLPQSFLQHISRGYNHNQLLALEFGKSLNIKATSILKQSLMNEEKDCMSFKLRYKHSLEDQNILLINDTYSPGADLERAISELRKQHPKQIYVLTLCSHDTNNT